MPADDMLKLAERCEQATGADRELDGRVWCAVNGHRFVRWIGFHERVPWGEIEGTDRKNTCSPGMVFERAGGANDRNSRFQQFTTSPAYTASLDAAMGLVPDWPVIRVEKPSTVRGMVWAAYLNSHPHCDEPACGGDAASPALALTAAALRALATKGQSDAR